VDPPPPPQPAKKTSNGTNNAPRLIVDPAHRLLDPFFSQQESDPQSRNNISLNPLVLAQSKFA
jgi:hypothetical protein